MTFWLKQSTAITLTLGPFVDETDGRTAETSLTLSQADIRLSKNGGAFAQKNESSSATHMENGYYSVALDTTDTNTLGRLRVAVNESGALPVWQDYMMLPANVWDSLFGADRLQVHADEITAGLITAAAIATGAIDADAVAADAVTEIQSGLATAAAQTAAQADLDNIQTRLPAALLDGLMPVDVQAISTDPDAALALQQVIPFLTAIFDENIRAALYLSQLNISNPAGPAILAEATSGINNGAEFHGVGGGSGILAQADSQGGHGIMAFGNQDGAGLRAIGGDTGPGISADGGDTSGHGISASAGGSGSGIQAVGVDTGAGLRLQGSNNNDLYLENAAATIQAAIWSHATRTLTSFGTLIADIWSYVTRTLTSGGGGATAADIWDYLTVDILTTGSIGKLIKDKLGLITSATQITVDSPVNGGLLTITKAVSLDSGLINATVPGDWTKCYVTGKKDKDDADSEALFQIVVSNPGAGSDGLRYLNGEAATANQGALTVDEDNNQVQFTLTDNATVQLARQGGYWDIKFLKSDGNSTRPVAGLMQIVLPVTLTV